MLVSHILRQKGRDVVTVAPTIVLAEVAHTLAKRKIGAVVVLGADGEVAGILSERDIVAALARDSAAALTRAANTYMTRSVATCEETDTIEEIMEIMTKGRFRHVPVLERGRLVGIVSIGDVVKTRIEESEREASALKQYIAAG
jgi:CBS domain-containing protein